MTRYLISFDACKLQGYPHSPGAGGAEVRVELRPADDEDYGDDGDDDDYDYDDDVDVIDGIRMMMIMRRRLL